MNIPTKQQILKRWDTLPDEIREFSVADETTDKLDEIYARLNIPEDKGAIASKCVSRVLFGFNHLEDLSLDIEQSIHINPLHARELADAIKTGLLNPLRDELEKIYSPIESDPASTVAAPAAAPATPSPSPIPTMHPETKEAPKPLDSISISSAPTIAQIAPKPAATIPAPAPTITLRPVEQKPAPFILESKPNAAPIAQAPKFRLDPLGKGMGSSVFGSASKIPAAPAPAPRAQLEIGREEESKKAPEMMNRIVDAPRVIHYSSLSTPVAPIAPRATAPGMPIPAPAPKTMNEIRPSSFAAIPPKPAIPPIPKAPATPSPLPPKQFGEFLKEVVSPEKKVPPPPKPLS